MITDCLIFASKFKDSVELRFYLAALIVPLLFSLGCSDENHSLSGRGSSKEEASELSPSSLHIEAAIGDTGSALVSAFSEADYDAGQALPPTLSSVSEEPACHLFLKFGQNDDLESDKIICWIGRHMIRVDLDRNGKFDGELESFALDETSEFGGFKYSEAVVPQVKIGEDVHTNLNFKIARPIAPSKAPTASVKDVSAIKSAVTKTAIIKATISIKLWGWDESTTGANLVPLRLSPKANKANAIPVVHFGGPLAMGIYREFESLKIGQQTDFYSLIGTQGQGVGTLTAIENTEIPTDASPRAKFTFPHKDPSQPPIVVNSILETRC